MTNATVIPAAVLAARQAAGLSRRALIDRMRAQGRGMHLMSLYRIEKGVRGAAPETAAALADALGVALDDLTRQAAA